MISVLHTADVHLGAKLLKLGRKSEDQRIQIQRTFESIVNLAIEKRVNLFIIAGDLFDASHPDKYLIDFVLSNLAKLNDNKIYTCIAAGTHDFYAEGNIFSAVDASGLSYIKIFTDPNVKEYAIDELSLIVFCNTSLSNKTTASPLDGIRRNENYVYNVAIAHGSVQIPGKSSPNDSPIAFEEIESSGMDYVALGHWHNQQNVSKGNVTAWYSGAPEMIDLDQTGSGKVLLATLSGNKEVSVESIQTGKRLFDSIRVDISSCGTFEDIITKVRQNADLNLVRSVTIEGIASLDFAVLDTNEIIKRLDDDFFFMQIRNNSHVLDRDIEAAFEDSLLKQKFLEHVKNMHKEVDIEKEVLQLGILLLDGKTKVY